MKGSGIISFLLRGNENHFLSLFEGFSIAKSCLTPKGETIRLVLRNSMVKQYEKTMTIEQR